MDNNDESKDIYIKNHTCYYFDDIVKIEDSILIIFYWMKNHTRIF